MLGFLRDLASPLMPIFVLLYVGFVIYQLYQSSECETGVKVQELVIYGLIGIFLFIVIPYATGVWILAALIFFVIIAVFIL